jgi:hypothetical protein
VASAAQPPAHRARRAQQLSRVLQSQHDAACVGLVHESRRLGLERHRPADLRSGGGRGTLASQHPRLDQRQPIAAPERNYLVGRKPAPLLARSRQRHRNQLRGTLGVAVLVDPQRADRPLAPARVADSMCERAHRVLGELKARHRAPPAGLPRRQLAVHEHRHERHLAAIASSLIERGGDIGCRGDQRGHEQRDDRVAGAGGCERPHRSPVVLGTRAREQIDRVVERRGRRQPRR